MIEKILECFKEEMERIDRKFSTGLYSIEEYRNRIAEFRECSDIVILVAKSQYSNEEINVLIKKYLIS